MNFRTFMEKVGKKLYINIFIDSKKNSEKQRIMLGRMEEKVGMDEKEGLDGQKKIMGWLRRRMG